ncbi:MAG: aldo/keto reductase [Kiritimatiellae bacterium]|nr:aldo/keto reductase [Kiritimatiellia bacterium]
MTGKSGYSRRDFFKGASVLAGAAALGGVGTSTAGAAVAAKAAIPRRKLGKTDLELPAVSIGTGADNSDLNVIKYAISQGMNFVHTSTGYKKGVAIKNVGEAIKGQRDKLTLALKITWAPDDDAALDAAFETLGVDNVDIAFFNIHKASQVSDPKFRKGAERWIKMGKFRYIGLTSHKETAACLSAALDQGFYNALMPAYNISMEEEFLPIFERAEKEGVGVVLMKSGRGLNGDAYYDAVPQYLATTGITTINKGYGSFRDVQKQIEAAGQPADAEIGKRVREAAAVAMTGHCQMCGICDQVCPRGLPVADVVRCSDYYMEHALYVGTAFQTYEELKDRPQTAICGDCDLCERACPNGVPVMHHIRRAETTLA